MLENKEVNKFSNYLDSISTDSFSDNLQAREELQEISRGDKNKPESGLLKIEEIGKTHNFTKEEIKGLIFEFIEFKSNKRDLIDTSHRKEDNETSKTCNKRISGSFDEYICKVLDDLDQEFLKNLYSHLGGNPYYLKENL